MVVELSTLCFDVKISCKLFLWSATEKCYESVLLYSRKIFIDRRKFSSVQMSFFRELITLFSANPIVTEENFKFPRKYDFFLWLIGLSPAAAAGAAGHGRAGNSAIIINICTMYPLVFLQEAVWAPPLLKSAIGQVTRFHDGLDSWLHGKCQETGRKPGQNRPRGPKVELQSRKIIKITKITKYPQFL